MQIEEKIKQYLAENILFSDDGYAYAEDASFLEEGILDSVGMLELALFVGETFGLEVDRQDLKPENFDSVANLAAYVRRQTAVLAN
ncbi:MAG: acyl carrier protein [Anaerolineales bacterium]|nr:acyl carrier protein [Anaerolineales bacterium]MCA9929634.1 acyl carrier protein [Anaerolineales bacterium]